MRIRRIFQIISYLQYPLMLLALFFSIKPYLRGFEYVVHNLDVLLQYYNYVLIFAGLSISFSTLQDTRKVQNNFSRKIWENPRKGKKMIGLISGLVILVLGYGIFGYFITENEKIKELSFGAIVLGIGLIGFLKTAIEVFDNHRLDKNTIPEIHISKVKLVPLQKAVVGYKN
ncbi:hypothetical protein RM549_08925 [Salegentibacter sp. F188]|uniref:Uncharacterized protein n=1 Tax=Autumnicola patrickiae TaxID=3075591 RepID=A0ABU3E3S4_9FLAO|nr:hypothetical protein [Salegentibacter sp. F188]MDT0689907.1 hypothetical protein [Salegentibacter sp. F188]